MRTQSLAGRVAQRVLILLLIRDRRYRPALYRLQAAASADLSEARRRALNDPAVTTWEH